MSEVPARRYALDPEDVRAALEAAWPTVRPEVDEGPASPRTLALLLAHIALETGMTSCMNWNLGNVKATGLDTVEYCRFGTWELIDGVRTDMRANFRSFPTLRAGAEFYLSFLYTHYPWSWPHLLSGDPIAFSHALKLHGYYTASEADYDRGMLARFHFYLTRHAQTMLCARGYPVTVDGFDGPKTDQALMHFQGARGMTQTGTLDDDTLSALATPDDPGDEAS